VLKTGYVFCGVLLALILSTQPAKADSGVSYVISGVYSSTTTSSQLSGASDTFTMSFSVPSQPVTTNFLVGDYFSVDAPIPFSFSASNGGTASGLMYVSFYTPSSSSQPGGLFVDFCAGGPSCATGQEFQWEVPGPLLYSGLESSPTLFPTSFNFTGGQFLLYHCTFCNNLDASGTFDGSVNATVVAAPEPGSALLLVLGILAIFAVGFHQKRTSTFARS
jgi:hypothetical protein